ncbi:hypothetical protein SAMD00019534_103130 [Acytostelium subglobosum LB1]|uniref:hypothetical protein n=1 Tax=Acytostelium subglobosum LB1 TaxID=1410327 RepID=UPI000644FD1C|nr:hypothetical protein SAMD00019534_103130 [Acytostelium subglobosum LB1]GAM27138.1 hypothetical protein SAMD00019534_103130 [Acytostelium subglobosum LB1]|eukprot:XP_012750018.1 hypothetical protein SAMD00019534_103130 [Acytostelium subglobosum LB1]
MTIDNLNDLPKFVLVEIFKNLRLKTCNSTMGKDSFFNNYGSDSDVVTQDSYARMEDTKAFGSQVSANASQADSANGAQPTQTDSDGCVRPNFKKMSREEIHKMCKSFMSSYMDNIITLSLVCKLWAKQIVPISSCHVVKVVSQRQFYTLFKYMTQGIVEEGATCLFSTIKFFCGSNQLVPKDYRLLYTQCTSVRSLCFDKNQLSFCDIVVLAEFIKESKNITDIKIPNNFTPHSFKLFCDALKYNQSLAILDMSSTPMTLDCINSLKEALKVNRTLSYLDLSFNSIGSNGIYLAEILRTNSSLKSLFLIGNELDDESVCAFAEILRNKNRSLTEISLSENAFDDSVGAMLGNIFKDNRTLRSLDISANQLGEETAASFAESLVQCTTLTSLNISECSLANDGGINLFQTLQNNTSIRHLILWSCDLNQDSLKDELASFIKNNRTVTTLSLGYNDLTSNDIIPIIKDGLIYNTTLQVLSLNNNHIDSQGGIELARYLETNTSLQELLLLDNLIENVGAIAFIIALVKNHTIQKMCLTQNKICPYITPCYRRIVAYNRPVCASQKQLWISAKYQLVMKELTPLKEYLAKPCAFSEILRILFDLLNCCMGSITSAINCLSSTVCSTPWLRITDKKLLSSPSKSSSNNSGNNNGNNNNNNNNNSGN